MYTMPAGLVSAVDDADAPADDAASHKLSEHAQRLKTVAHWSGIAEDLKVTL